MTLASRIKLAWQAMRGGSETKANIMAWPEWRQGKPEWRIYDFDSYVSEGYNSNSLIYSAIMYKARSLTSAPLRAYFGDPDHPDLLPYDHPLTKLISRPNAYQSSIEFGQINVVYLNISGNVFIMLDRIRESDMPHAMYSLRPDRTYIVPGKDGGIKGYLYVPEGKPLADGVPILPNDMIHIKLPSPSDPLEGWGYGLSPISPLARSGDVDNQITQFLKVFFQRGSMISVSLNFPKDISLDEPTIARIRARWHEIYGGFENWTEPGIFDMGGEMKRVGMTFEEMGFQGIDERNESRILGPFGVPPILIGTRVGLNRATYSNYEEARRAFWEDTFLPELSLFETEFEYYLKTNDGAFPKYDTSKVPALRVDIPKLAEAAHRLWTMGVPANLALQTVGLTMEDIPGGESSFVPMNFILQGTLPQVEEPDMADSQSSEERTDELNKSFDMAKKRRVNNVVNSIARGWEAKFSNEAKKQFELDRRGLLASLGAFKSYSLQMKESIDWERFKIEVDEFLRNSGEEWRKAFMPLIQGIIQDQGEQWALMLGTEFNVANLFSETWFDNYVMKFADGVSNTTGDTLNNVLQQAQIEGWSIPRMQRNLEMIFRQWMSGDVSSEEFNWFEQRVPQYRTELIARTETIRSSNHGSVEMFRQWGMNNKEWITHIDERTCAFCNYMDGRIIGVSENFFNQGDVLHVGEGKQDNMAFDYENVLAPPLHPDCRCTITAVV